MSGVIKGYNGAGFVVNGRVRIDNRLGSEICKDPAQTGARPKNQPLQQAPQQFKMPDSEQDKVNSIIQQQENSLRQREESQKKELEAMKARVLADAEKAAADIRQKAEEEAAWVVENANRDIAHAKETAEGIIAQADAEAQKVADEAREKGFNEGLEKGLADGYDQGYLNGLKKCKETLLELKRINSDILEKKSEIFKNYERQIFDVALEIAQKITIDSIKQKGKSTLQRMVKEAAKEFRAAQNVKISLSELDFADETQVDYEQIKSLFLPETTVEIEILKDAESGTLIVDNGSEIIDAGVPTQLRMIGELGRGKYRDKPSEYENIAVEAQNESVSELDEEAPEEQAEPVQQAESAQQVEEQQTAPDEAEEMPVLETEAEEQIEQQAEAVQEMEEQSEPVLEEIAEEQAVESQPEELPELTPSGAMPELMLIDDSGSAVSADELEKKSEEQAAAAAQAQKAELEKFEELEMEHAKEMEREAKKATRSSRSRKPTNPLLGKMLDNLGD